MSYILDALTRSEQQRNRGSVPDLHTVQAPLPQRETPSGSRAGYFAAGILLAGVGAAAVWLHALDSGGAKSASMQTEPLALQRPQVLAAATPPIPAPSTKLAEQETRPPLSGAPVDDPPLPARIPSKPKKEKPTQKPPEATRPRNERVPGELPAALQNELPKLEISGFADSRDTGRMALINGRVVVEGDEFAGLTVETIAPHSVTLRYKDQRFRQSY